LNITITGDATEGDYNIFRVGGPKNTQIEVAIGHLTLKGGGGTAAQSRLSGGAIQSYADLTVGFCTLRDNNAVTGGAITAWSGKLTLTNCDLFNNEARNGGAIYINDKVTEVKITGGSIHDNTADSGDFEARGGGIYISGGSKVPIDLKDVEIKQNKAKTGGGGIAVRNNINGGGSPKLTLGVGTVIRNNSATEAAAMGGGVYFGAGALAIDAGAVIYSNTAGSGGGLYRVTGTTWNSEDSNILYNESDNVASGGGN